MTVLDHIRTLARTAPIRRTATTNPALAAPVNQLGFGSGPISDIQNATPAKKKQRCWSAWTRLLSNVAAS